MEKKYSFKKFTEQHARLENRITITKSNTIGFPSQFFNENKIDEYKYAVLYWDDDNKAIAIELTNDEKEENKFSILKSKAGYGGSVIARSFFKVNKISPEIYHGRYEWKKENLEGIGNVFIIDLKSK